MVTMLFGQVVVTKGGSGCLAVGANVQVVVEMGILSLSLSLVCGELVGESRLYVSKAC